MSASTKVLKRPTEERGASEKSSKKRKTCFLRTSGARRGRDKTTATSRNSKNRTIKKLRSTKLPKGLLLPKEKSNLEKCKCSYLITRLKHIKNFTVTQVRKEEERKVKFKEEKEVSGEV